jgi:glycosyltransferase involved in cell wall biosynthesis
VLRILFPRDFKETPDGSLRTSGDHLKVRDYFDHALAHPELDPHVYFTPRSVYEASDVWEGVPAERIVRELDVSRYDLLFVTGKEWKLLPRDVDGGRLIQFVQSIQQCEPEHQLFRYFKRRAHRICTSNEVAAACAPYIDGEPVVIPDGIPLDVFRPGEARRERSVLIWGRKNPELAAQLRDVLVERGLAVDLLIANLPRREFARRLAGSEIAVTLPRKTEGFFLPALEGMACGAAVVCPDALGNRSFCIDGETCLMPPRDDVRAHIEAVERLVASPPIAAALRARGLQMAQNFPLAREREAFHRFVDERVLAPAPR